MRLTVRQGLWTAVLISLPGCLALWHGEQILLLLRQPPSWRRWPANTCAPCFGPAAVPGPSSWLAGIVQRLGNLGGGPPALGLVGAGVASALASLFLGLALVVLRDRRFRRYRLFGDLLQPDWQRLAAFWKLGLPSAWPPPSRSPSSTPPPS